MSIYARTNEKTRNDKGAEKSFIKRNMKGGASMSTGAFIGLALVIVFGVIGGLYLLSGGKIGSIASPSGTSLVSGQFAGSCPSNPATKPVLGAGASYQDQLNHNTNTTAQVPVNLSVRGAAYSYRQFLTNTIGLVTDQNQSCGTFINLTFGDSKTTGYYSTQAPTIQIGQNNTNVQYTGLQKEATIASMVWNNATGSYITWTGANTVGTSIITPGAAVTGGSTYSVQFTQKPGSGYFGGGGVLFYVTANSAGVSGISISGPNGPLPSAPVAYASTYNTFSGSRTWAFLAPGYQIWGPAGGVQYSVSFTTSSGYGANVVANFGWNDCPNYFQNGHITNTCSNGGLNPNTGADLGEPLVMQGGTADVCAVTGCAINQFTTGNTLVTYGSTDLGPVALLKQR